MVISSPEDRASVDPMLYRGVIGRFATGIAVVTTHSDGTGHAMTVNSLTSVSLGPSSTQVSGPSRSSARTTNQPVGGSPAGARPLTDQLTGAKHTAGPITGAPVLDDAIGVLECRTRGVYDGGDHSIVLGEVLAASVPAGPALPLLHYEGTYRRLEGGDS